MIFQEKSLGIKVSLLCDNYSLNDRNVSTMNRLSEAKRVQVVAAPVKGNSIELWVYGDEDEEAKDSKDSSSL
jgi:predicted small secreted protein